MAQLSGTPSATKIGFALWAVSILWCLSYYGQYHGFFGFIGLKIWCLDSATSECLFFSEQIEKAGSVIPTYYPVLWWLGLAALAYGTYQSVQMRKAAQQNAAQQNTPGDR